jgi:hypothetical protein
VWTDKEGDHYTNDPSTIPRGVKVRTTEGVPVEVVKSRPVQQGAAAPEPAARNRCQVAREALARAEARLAAARAPVPAEGRAARCQEQLAIGGQASYAACMVAADTEGEALRKEELRDAEAEVQRAKDELRRVTYGGCG